MAPDIGVLLVEDHPLMRNGIKSLIADNGEFKVIAEAGTLADARGHLSRQEIHLILLDISLPDGSGLELLREIRASGSKVRIIVLTMHNEGPYLASAIKQGADGYVVKDMAPEKLIFTMKTVIEGQQCFFGSKSEARIEPGDIGHDDSKSQRLSAREEKVMSMLIEGKALTEIAAELDLSVKTVFTYRVRLLKKLGLKNNAELIKAQLSGELKRLMP